MKLAQRVGLILSMLFFCAVGTAAEQANTAGFYKEPPLFSAPSETASLQTIGRFGPVGMGIDLVQPAFAMKVHNIEEGSPAAATGKLNAGQIIETINGQKLADIDPRIQLAKIITDAEAADGVVKFMVKDAPGTAAREVIVKIPALGAYSKTWPLNCPKSDRIVRAYGDYLATKDSGGTGLNGFQLLFLLSTGEDKDLETARKWVKTIVADCKNGKGVSNYAWFIGIAGTPLCEYYLRTGDKSVLPVIKAYADYARVNQTRGGWAGRGGQAAVTYGGGGGHLNAGGTAVVTFLCLAKECGVDVDERTLQSAVSHFYRFAGRGSNPYGDNRPETGFVDNGKNGNLALAMAAAASLTPDGESSIYARASEACAMSGYYNTSFMLHGHTGGGIGEVWRSAAMGLLYDKSPRKYRDFMDSRQWIYELSRRWTGSFGIVGGAGYDNETWGAGLALTYTIPRKKLRLAGAPKTPYVMEHPLPVRPWGVAADDVFESLDAPADKSGNKLDLSNENLANDACKAVLRKLTVPGDVSDDLLRKYAHHQDHEIRKVATRKVMGANSGYLGWKSRGGSVKLGLMVELLKDRDPRVRQAAIDGLIYGLTTDKRDKEADVEIDASKYFTQEIFDLLIGMIQDANESWWVKDHALRALQFATADMLAPHVDLILRYLQDKDWWFQNAALEALTPVAADDRCYKKVLPAVGELIRTCDAYNALGPIGGISEQIQKGSPEVQKLAANTLGHSFETFAVPKASPAGQNLAGAYDRHLGVLAGALAKVPGGYNTLYAIAKQRFPNDPLPFKELFLNADPNQLGPELQKAIVPIIRDQLIYGYIGKNRRALQAEVARTRQSVHTEGKIDELTGLYRKIGVHDYDWHNFGPDLRNQPWEYFMFDPKEKQAYDISPWRYRSVTYPAGMEKWQAADFDPAKAGWKTGLPPFGQYDGKLVTDAKPCSNSDCACKAPMRTLWDKEVLLVHKTFKVPPLQPGCLYRIRNGQGQHVGSGDGFRVYINGKLLIEVKEGNGKRTGGKPRGAFITKEFADEFAKGEITISATAFLRYGNKAIVKMPPVPQGIFSIWLEEMKLPPLDDEAVQKSATVIPMLTSAWQAKQDPDTTEVLGEEDLFLYDGKFVANPKVLGSWTTVAQVDAIDKFTPEQAAPEPSAPKKGASKKGAGKAAAKKSTKAGQINITEITFKDNGLTNNAMQIWSGDTLMDLDRYQALKMTVKTIDGTDYLFIESGGFSEKNPVGWKSPLNVMKRQAK
jgi:hypothetical protein